jgi:hypothetical protein
MENEYSTWERLAESGKNNEKKGRKKGNKPSEMQFISRGKPTHTALAIKLSHHWA